jgi:hypothetical protein
MMTSKGSIKRAAIMVHFHTPFILSAEVPMMNPVMIQKMNEEINASKGSFLISIGVISRIPAPIHKRIPRWSFLMYYKIR